MLILWLSYVLARDLTCCRSDHAALRLHQECRNSVHTSLDAQGGCCTRRSFCIQALFTRYYRGRSFFSLLFFLTGGVGVKRVGFSLHRRHHGSQGYLLPLVGYELDAALYRKRDWERCCQRVGRIGSGAIPRCEWCSPRELDGWLCSPFDIAESGYQCVSADVYEGASTVG